MTKVFCRCAVLGFALMMAVVFLSAGMSGSADAAPSGPIYIGSDAELDAMGLPGDGSEGDPYILSGLEIDATGNSYAISINFVNKHLWISECILENSNHVGIEVWYSSNIWIQGNTIRNNADDAITLYSCNNVSMTGNDCWNNPLYGVAIRVASDIEVVGNYFTNSADGLNLENVERSELSGNLITYMNGAGISLKDSGNNTIYENEVNNNNAGIVLYGSNSNSVHNNTCDNNDGDGLSVDYSHGNDIRDNLCSNNSVNGIAIYSSEASSFSNNITNNSCFQNGYVLDGAGIYVSSSSAYSSTGNSIAHNECDSNNYYGIWVLNSPNNVVSSNDVIKSNGSGILVQGSSGSQVSFNNLVLNGDSGIWLDDSEGCAVHNNIARLNTDGAYLSDSNHNDLYSNEFQGNSYGVYVDGSANNSIADNNCSDNVGGAGIYLYISTYNTIQNNTCSGSNVGISLYRSNDNAFTNNTCDGNNHNLFMNKANNNTVVGNTATNGNDGVYVSSSTNNTIADNNCLGSFFGVFLVDSNNNTISGNDCTFGNNYGIYLDSSPSNIINNNTCSNASVGIALLDSNNNTIAGNVAQGNIKGISLVSSDGNALIENECLGNDEEGGISLSSFSDHNTIFNNSCHGNNLGIYVGDSSYSTIDGNDLSGNNFAGFVIMGESSNLVLTHNNCSDNGFFGIQIGRADHYSIVGNICNGNSVHGIYLEYSPFDATLISNNTCSYNGEVGIYALDTTSTEISNNTCVGNTLYGIRLGSSQGNVLYGNILTDNNGATSVFDGSHVQAFDDGLNCWNLSSNGNFWSDWTSPDLDGDGIVDEAYLIDGGTGKDMMPLAVSIVITSPAEGAATEDANVGLSGTAISFFGVVQVKWYNTATGGSGVCAGTEAWTATIALVEGANLITVTMTDLSGIERSDSVSVVLDTTPPSLVITSPTEGAYVGSSVTVSWTGNDAGTGVAYYVVSIEGMFSVNTTDSSYTINGLADGTYTVMVSAYDELDHCKDEVITFTVEVASPTINIVSPADGLINTTGSITLTWAGSDAGSGVDRYVVSWEGGSQVTLQSSVGSHTFTGLSDGSHVLTVTVFDKFGRSSSDSVTVVVDTQVPSITIISPVQDGFVNSADVTITWSGSDAGTGVAYYTASIEGLAFFNTTDTSCVFNDLADDMYTVLVSAYDHLGNYLDVTVEFTVDTLAPSLVIDSPVEGQLFNASSMTVIWTIADTNPGTVQVMLDGEGWTTATGEELVWIALTDGHHIAYVKVTDAAGNSVEKSANFTVDTVAPTAEISPIGDELELDQVVLVEFSEAMNQTSVMISVPGVTGTIAWEGNSATFTPSALQFNRIYAVAVSGKDLAGNSMEINWTFSTRSVGNLTGLILDENGDPVPGVTVTAGGEFTALTDENGRFVFSNLSLGTYLFEVNVEGYEPFTFNATIEQGVTVDEGTVEMVPQGAEGEGDGDDGSIWLYVIIAIAVLAVVGIVAFILLRKK